MENETNQKTKDVGMFIIVLLMAIFLFGVCILLFGEIGFIMTIIGFILLAIFGLSILFPKK